MLTPISCGSMCLFTQNQDFQRQTENTLNTLADSSRAAASSLQHVNSYLEVATESLTDVDMKLQDIDREQQVINGNVKLQLDYMHILKEKAAAVELQMQSLAEHEVLLEEHPAWQENDEGAHRDPYKNSLGYGCRPIF